MTRGVIFTAILPSAQNGVHTGLAAVALALLWGALSAYAVLAGADFGGGLLDLIARGPRAALQRTAIATAMGPVWEANHVWLIFFLTGLFTVFPAAFAVAMVALYLPLLLALVGIVLRGAAFAFRAQLSDQHAGHRRLGRVFGIASLITPFLLGASAGAIVGRTVRYRGGEVISGGVIAVFTGPLQLVCGALAVAICGYLAACYLLVDLARSGQDHLLGDFRSRALIAGAIAGGLSIAGLILAGLQTPRFFDRLTSHALPLVALAVILGTVSLGAVWARRYSLARVAAAAAVTSVLWGWGIAQYPRLIGPDLTITNAVASPAMLVAFLIVTGLGMLLLVPALWLLYVSFRAKRPIRAVDEPS